MYLGDFTRGARTSGRVKEHMLRTGYTLFGSRLWSEQEDVICHICYPDYFAMAQILDGRTPAAIKARCRKLGLVRKRKHWGPLEKMRLRKMYPEGSREDICAAFPGVEWQNIRSSAQYYGYRRKKKPYKITGVVALDEFRRFCYDEKINMREADEDAGTKRYFQTRGYRSAHPNFRYIYRAVKFYGGVLNVRWDRDTG
jgi:hypothetical protein